MPPVGRPPTKISQHNKVCLTTEEAKAVYECLNQDQIVSPIHFDKDLPKLHSIREAAYAKLEHIHIPMNMLCCTQIMNFQPKHQR